MLESTNNVMKNKTRSHALLGCILDALESTIQRVSKMACISSMETLDVLERAFKHIRNEESYSSRMHIIDVPESILKHAQISFQEVHDF